MTGRLSSMTYPQDFPCPAISPYNYSVDMGLIRSSMSGGNTRQRRLYSTMPHLFNLTFRMPVKTLVSWQYWVNRFGYGWFNIMMSSMFCTDGNVAQLHMVRFTSDLNITMFTYGWMEVTVQAELTSDALAYVPRPPGVGAGVTGDWIVAQHPRTASKDKVIAGNPHTAVPDRVIAGTPAVPNATIYF
jgi:hypothetical protein